MTLADVDSLDERMEEPTPRRIRRVLCLSDSDTRMKWTIAVADVLRRHSECVVAENNVPKRARVPHDVQRIDVEVVSIEGGAVPSDRQADELGVVGARRTVSVDDYPDLLDEGFDVIVCNTVGSRLHLLTERLRERSAESAIRPIVITGYAGLVYEKHVEGALWRASADIVCCNSQHDAAAFRRLYSRLGLDPDVLVSTGLAVAGRPSSTSRPTPTAIRTLTFAVQPDVPRDLSRRRYLVERLVDYAQVHSDRAVVVKLRSRPDESTTHRERHHYAEIFERHITDRPTNLSFEYGLMSDVLERTDLLVTVSSTAALEALASGIPAAILSDLGVREELGNHFFAESGLLRSMDELIDDEVPTVEPNWMRAHGFGPDDSMDNLVDRLDRLLVAIPSAVPPAFYGQRRTPFVNQRLVTRPTLPKSERPAGHRLRRQAIRVLDGPVRTTYRRFHRWVRP